MGQGENIAMLHGEPDQIRQDIEALVETDTPGRIDRIIAGFYHASPGVQQAAVNALIQIGGKEVVARLLRMFREPPNVRNMAAEVLEQILPTHVADIDEIAKSPDPNIRKLIVDTLGKQTDAAAIPRLIQFLQDPNINVRASAAEALGALQATTAIPHLLPLLHDDEWVAFSVIHALTHLRATQALGPIIELAGTADDPIQSAAIEALAILDTTGSTVPMLTNLVEVGNEELCRSIVKALTAITRHTGPTLWTTLRRDLWVPLLITLLSDQDPTVQLSAMTALGYIGDHRGTAPILEMYKRLQPSSNEIADQIVSALAATADHDALRAVLTADPNDEAVASVAIRALGILRVDAAVATLGQLLAQVTNPTIRIQIVHALGKIGTKDALDLVGEAIQDETGYVRQESIRILGETGRAELVDILLKRLVEERYPDVRETIINALVALNVPELTTRIPALVEHRKPSVREAAAQLIGHLVPPNGFDWLQPLRNDPEWSVRLSVIQAISRYTHPEVFETLLLALSDEHERVRTGAVQGLVGQRSKLANDALITQGLLDQHIWVRYHAAEGLGINQVHAAVPVLTEMAKQSGQPALIRRAALTALDRIGTPAAIQALKECHNLQDGSLREKATEMLRRKASLEEGHE